MSQKPRPASEKPKVTRPFSALKNAPPSKNFLSSNLQISQIPLKYSNILPNLKEKEDQHSKKEPFFTPLNEKNLHQIVEFPLNYRIAHPGKSNYLVSLEFWKETNENLKRLIFFVNLYKTF